MREDLLGWKGVTIVLEEATGEQADHFKERANIHTSLSGLQLQKAKVKSDRTEGIRVMGRFALSLDKGVGIF